MARFGHAIRGVLCEPALCFLGIGLFLIAVRSPRGEERRIVVDDTELRALCDDYQLRNGHWPDAGEQRALVDRFVADELLYREAKATGLEEGDLVIRRRLIQKMRFVLERDAVPQPGDADLRIHLAQHAARYRVPERIALTQVFVDAGRHGEQTDEVAEQLRSRLATGAAPATLGDPFPLGTHLSLRSPAELRRQFGAAFAAAVADLPSGRWSNPIRTRFGLHLVRIDRRVAARLPDLSEIRAAVRADWLEEHRKAATRAEIARLRSQYEIEAPAYDVSGGGVGR
jgi:peptidyl-prolyl cis-trans isomerase C